MWKLWIILAFLLAMISIYSNKFSLIQLTISSLFTLLLALFLPSLLLQTLLFIFISLLLLFLSDKFSFLKLYKTQKIPFDTNKLIGGIGIVTKTIGKNPLESGLVKLDGEVWSAISSSSKIIQKGNTVQVTAVNGVRLTVIPSFKTTKHFNFHIPLIIATMLHSVFSHKIFDKPFRHIIHKERTKKEGTP